MCDRISNKQLYDQFATVRGAELTAKLDSMAGLTDWRDMLRISVEALTQEAGLNSPKRFTDDNYMRVVSILAYLPCYLISVNRHTTGAMGITRPDGFAVCNRFEEPMGVRTPDYVGIHWIIEDYPHHLVYLNDLPAAAMKKLKKQHTRLYGFPSPLNGKTGARRLVDLMTLLIEG